MRSEVDAGRPVRPHPSPRYGLARSDDPVAAVKALGPMIRERAYDEEVKARLDDAVVEALVASGTMTLMVPAELGGGEADPSVQLDVCEEMAYADGSTGWAVMASMTGLGTFLSLLPDSGVDKVLSSPNFIVAGAVAPPGTAVAQPDGGYLLNGRFSFASGSAHAGWFLGGYAEVDADGQPVVRADGSRKVMFALAPANKVEPLGNWDVLGLVATASIDYAVRDYMVDADLIAPGEFPVRGGALYGMGLKSLPGLGHGGVAVGIARRALEEFTEIAQLKARPPSGLLSRHEVLQDGYAKARADLLSARAFLHDAYNRLFRATRDHEATDDAMKADCRLASTHAAFTGAKVAEWAYLNSGSVGLRNGSALQRCFRDAHAASQHLFTGPQIYIEAGRVYLTTPGLSPTHRALMTVTVTPPLPS